MGGQRVRQFRPAADLDIAHGGDAHGPDSNSTVWMLSVHTTASSPPTMV